MSRFPALLVVAALLLTGCGNDSDADSASSTTPAIPAAESAAVASYADAVRTIDADWQAQVDAAFEGREYLRTGALPADFEPTTAALNDLLEAASGNLEELIAVTNTTLDELEALDVPPSVQGIHAGYTALLNGFVQRWSAGLNFIKEGDAEGFLRFYVTFQPEREALELSLGTSREELDRLPSGG